MPEQDSDINNEGIIPLTNVLLLSIQLTDLMIIPAGRLLVVAGPSGSGKTSALQYFLSSAPRPVSAVSVTVPIDYPSQSVAQYSSVNPVSALNNLLHQADGAAIHRALIDSGKRLLLVDNAHCLPADVFGVLAKVLDYGDIAVALVGRVLLKQKVQYLTGRQDTFIPWTFFAPSPEEVCQILLPALQIDRWCFNPRVADEYERGMYVWNLAESSVGRLIALIRQASAIAIAQSVPCITLSILDQAAQANEWQS